MLGLFVVISAAVLRHMADSNNSVMLVSLGLGSCQHFAQVSSLHWRLRLVQWLLFGCMARTPSILRCLFFWAAPVARLVSCLES